MAAISGTASAPQAFRGDASSRNEKSGNLASCLLVGGVLFGHWRSGTTFSLVTGGAIRRAVRKHRAPKGALRRRQRATLLRRRATHQKAPSAKRCIMTRVHGTRHSRTALVRKHRAPNGALRPSTRVVETEQHQSESPSAKRCIKTCRRRPARTGSTRSESTECQKVH